MLLMTGHGNGTVRCGSQVDLTLFPARNETWVVAADFLNQLVFLACDREVMSGAMLRTMGPLLVELAAVRPNEAPRAVQTASC